VNEEGDEAAPRARRARDPDATLPEMVPRYELDLAIERRMAKFRAEFVSNIDRQALERAIRRAEDAEARANEAKAADVASRAISHRRFMRLIATHVVTLVLFLTLATCAAMQFVYASENRARLEFLERLTERSHP
jgi:hypothetical protein